MLEEEKAGHRQELQQRFTKIYEQQKAARMQAVEHERARREEERRQQVSKADELRHRQQRHVYREEYSRQLQEYLNQTRHLEIQLKNHLREKYGPPPPPGRRQAPTAFSHAAIAATNHSSSADHGHNTREEHVGMWCPCLALPRVAVQTNNPLAPTSPGSSPTGASDGDYKCND
ncbi:hypothetical protein E2C01_038396 [Portunus trituberculatus]|uniref:Uncharacterized protein n=1 Tax=Portunus trituberculatus TaxID=210409 RepID=A0A5B7FGP7_PORTR|nr:hypothetical protein [Portunus trituberculatus]